MLLRHSMFSLFCFFVTTVKRTMDKGPLGLVSLRFVGHTTELLPKDTCTQYADTHERLKWRDRFTTPPITRSNLFATGLKVMLPNPKLRRTGNFNSHRRNLCPRFFFKPYPTVTLFLSHKTVPLKYNLFYITIRTLDTNFWNSTMTKNENGTYRYQLLIM